MKDERRSGEQPGGCRRGGLGQSGVPNPPGAVRGRRGWSGTAARGSALSSPAVPGPERGQRERFVRENEAGIGVRGERCRRWRL